MGPGRLIVIEGLDGSGKATQATLLAAQLAKEDKRVKKISFPDYGSESSAPVKMYLAGEVGDLDEVNVYAASSFYAVDRYISYMRQWQKEYKSGYTIVADRYTTSNIAHQMPKLPESEWGAYLDWLEDYEYKRMRLPRPDIVLYLDMQPETSRMLLAERYKGKAPPQDIHERDMQYLTNCRRAALYAADLLGWQVLRCCDGEKPLPIDIIGRIIMDYIHLNDKENDKKGS